MSFRRAKIINIVIFATFLIFSLLGCGSTGSKDSEGGGSGGGGDTVGSVTVSANPTSINADGTSTSTVTVRVTDSNGDTIADNTTVSLSTTRGTLATTSGSTISGEFSTILTSASVTGEAVITASAGGISDQVTVNFTSSNIATIFLTADPNNLRNDGSSRSTLEALVTDGFGNIVSDGLAITFTLEAGSTGNLVPGFTTTVDGIATVEYVASTDVGVQTIRAEAANGTFDTIDVTLTDVLVGSVVLTATPEAISADGSSQSQITATVRDESGQIVSDGTPVSFTATAGTLSDAIVTTLNGTATVVLTSPAAVGFGFADITASSAGVSDTARVTFSGIVDHIVLSATPVTLDANGTSTSELRAVVYDENNNVVGDGEIITFDVISGSGFISSPTATTTGGIATVTYTASITAGIETVQARSNNGTVDTVDITLNPAIVGSVSLTSGSASIVANGVSRSRINATVKDTNGHPIAGAVVNFTTTAGTLSAASVSTANGLASVLLTSSVNLGTATVTAEVDGYNNFTTVRFIPGPVDTLSLTGVPGNLSADGSSQSMVQAVARDASGNPISDETITFSAANGDIFPATEVTDASGIAGIIYTAPATVPGGGATGTDTITAVSTNGTVISFIMNINAAQVASLSLTAGSDEIFANGTSGSLITATVQGVGGVVQDGTTVSFSTTAGSLSSATATTVNGIASVTLTSPTNLGSATITAMAGGVSDMTTVRFIAGAVSSVVMTATPTNLSADGTSASTVRAVVSDANGNPVTGETISFSAISGTLSAATADTNASGIATVTYTAPYSVPAGGTDTIGAEATNGIGTTIFLNMIDVQIGSVAIDVGSSTVVADGAAGTSVTVKVTDTSGKNVSDGTMVDFVTTAGSLSDSSATTINGIAGVVLTSPTKLGSATVTATAGGKSASVQVTFVAGPVSSISLTAVPNNLSNGVSNTSVLYATVTDTNGNPVEGERIDFAAVFGSVNTVGLHSGFGVTDENGFVTATYFAPATVPAGGSDTITVTAANGTTYTAGISIIAVQIGSLSLSAGSSSVVADGGSGILIRATVKDINGNNVVDGTAVTFSTTAGTILPSAMITTVNGIASVTLRSATNIGTAVVSGTSGGVNDSVSVQFIAGAADTVVLTVMPSNLTADGVSTSAVQAAVTDAANNPVAGETITFSAASGRVSAATAVTNASGIATVTYTTPGAVGGGADTVTGTATNGESGTALITLIDVSIGSVSVSAGSTAVVADGSSSTQIRAVVKDLNGNNVADNTTVSFTTTAGTLSASTAETVSGMAVVTLQSATNLGTAHIIVTVGGLSNTTAVTFIPGAADNMTVSATPANLTADGTSTSTIRVTVLDAHDNPVDGETLTFGTVSGTLASLTATTANGVTNNQYTAPGSVPAGGSDIITVRTTNGVTVNTPITLIGPAISSISLVADPQTLPADGFTQATITATLTVVGGGSAPDGTPVSFSIRGGGGSISPTGTTAGGTAIATLTSGIVPETVTIRAEAGGRIAEIQVEYTPGSVAVTIIPNSLLGTGEETARVTAMVLNAAGDPVTEAGGITFTLDDGSLGTLIGANPADVTAGEATIDFRESAKGGTVTIFATWNNAGVAVTGSETIDIQPPPAFIEVAEGSPDPTSINIKGTGGQSTSQVIFDIKDSQGFPVADGYRVDFVIDSGPDGGEAIQPLFALTAGGKVSTILRSGLKSGPVSIKATYFYDTDVSTTMSQITINAGPPVGEEFGIFAQYLNISGLWIANLEDGMTVDVGDIYGNPVPDNTAISFKTYNTGGLMETADALTTGGLTTKILRSTSSPSPMQGFVSVTAEANNGGRTTHVTALAMPPVPDNNYIYAGTDGGGVYKSLDAGASWTNISRSSTIQGQNWIDPYVNDLAVDPDDANTIYAATGYLGKGHLYRSLDGGASWNSNNVEEWNGVVSLDNSVLTVLCDDNGSDYVWAGTEGLGAIFSTDGTNFGLSSTGLGTGKIVRDIVKAAGNGGSAVLYAATPTGVFKSTNGGVDWVAASAFAGDNITTLAVHPGVADVVYAGTLDAGVWVTDDGGTSWIQYTDGLGKGLSATDPVADSGNTGNGVMSDVTVDTDTLSENWTVTCITAAPNSGTFSVVGSVSGPQANAIVGAAYISAGAEIGFTIADGSVDFVTGDAFTFSTARDQGRYIKDLLVDAGNSNLYAITYFWGAEEPHAVGNVYVHGLVGGGLPDGNAWDEANIGLPAFSEDDSTLLAQHVMAPNVTGSPTALYIGGEGISLLKATGDLTTGSPEWQASQSGLTNLVMARMPVLFSGICSMTVDEIDIDPVDGTDDTFRVYIEDSNGNPPIQGSHFIVEKIDFDDKRETLFEVTYPDAYVYGGTFRDPSDSDTDIPFVITIPTAGTYKSVEFTFTPTCADEAPGCSGTDQILKYQG